MLGPLPENFLPLAICALLAGIVRGIAGFGLSAVMVASGSFFLTPKSLIPTSQVLELFGSIALLKSVWKDVNWQWLKPMALGYLIATPLGVTALTYAPTAWLRVFGCLVILVASVCLLSNMRPPVKDGIPLRLGTGLGAGFLAGATALGGMLASAMLFAADIPPKALRATLVVLFFFSALYSQAWGLYHGVLNAQSVTLAGWLLLPLLIGVGVGARGFSVVTPEQFKRYVLMVLAVLAFVGIAYELLRKIGAA